MIHGSGSARDVVPQHFLLEFYELKNEILLNYLNDENFTQNLYLKQNIIDNMLNEYILNELEPYYRDREDIHPLGILREFVGIKQINWLFFIKLYKVRNLKK